MFHSAKGPAAMSNLIVFYSPKHGQSDWDEKRQDGALNELWSQREVVEVSLFQYSQGVLFWCSDTDSDSKVGCKGAVSGTILGPFVNNDLGNSKVKLMAYILFSFLSYNEIAFFI